ncbi:putative oxidoreductase dhs-27 [Orchesella cincta]|uniref:Putative oxidoreductase dhs-27 n=1 Tax=Orchesella cincta TaxID=48709 RepID=A0A1D2ML77_ORCCI|nr:putative oxidoreductase dhs-27 [Orchesella cincta]
MPALPSSKNLGVTEATKLKYKEILKANGITDEVAEVNIKDSGLRGEGFISQQQYVSIKFQNPNLKPLNLFEKSHTANESHSVMVDDLKAFAKETRFFMDYVPAARELCKSKGQERLLDIYPKCYYGDDKLMIFENLVVDKGYVLLPKEEMQDFEAATFAMKTLAKHHAISHAMIKAQGGPQKFFQKFKSLDFESFSAPAFEFMIKSSLENNLNTNIQLLETNNIEGGEEALAKSKLWLNGKSYELVEEAINSLTDDEFAVLCHGDFWNNNMMFKRDPESNKITGHIAIDLQVTRYNSPALDISYYLFTSVKPAVRREHLQTLLTTYLETLHETTRNLDCPIDLTYDDLFLAIRKKFNYGFFFGICFGPAMNVLSNFDINEVGDITNMSSFVNKLIQDWLANNKEVGKEMAISFVDVLKEYDELKVD